MKSFKSLLIEASYAGNLGLMELLKFHQMATREQSNQIKLNSILKIMSMIKHGN